MKNIRIADMTLTENAVMQNSMSFKERIETVRLLDKLKTDIIHLPEIRDKKTDSLLIRTVAMSAKNSVLAVEAGMSDESIKAASDALKEYEKSRLTVSIPVSAVQMEYSLAQKPEKVLSLIKETVSKCTKLCNDVEFIAIDATRSEEDFLKQAIQCAIEAGSSTICLCDTAGTFLPDDIKKLVENVSSYTSPSKIKLSIMLSNELNMAAANALSAIKAGADEIKTSASGISATSLKTLIHALGVKSEYLGIKTKIATTQINNTLDRMTWVNNAKQAAILKTDETENDDEKLYDDTMDISALSKWIRRRGYDLSDEDMAKVYESFCHTAKKKKLRAREIDAIIASNALQVPETYKLISYVINSGNVINATADIILEKNGKKLCGLMAGDGPIDASFLSIEQIAGHHFELDDFQIQSVTQGREAMGDALVKLRHNGNLYSGKGISTDIIGASIRAYLNALNKIVYEEKM